VREGFAVSEARLFGLSLRDLTKDENEDRGDAWDILSQRSKLERAAMERGEKFADRLRVCTQKPHGFGNHGPTSQAEP
jgi:hypothetical protein